MNQPRDPKKKDHQKTLKPIGYRRLVVALESQVCWLGQSKAQVAQVAQVLGPRQRMQQRHQEG